MERKVNKIFFLTMFCLNICISYGLQAEELLNSRLRTGELLDYAPDPALIADKIVVFEPNKKMDLNKIKSYEKEITGKIQNIEKGDITPTLIVHKSRTIIMPLQEKKLVRMYLKKFTDRDAYYPIAIFSILDSNDKGER